MAFRRRQLIDRQLPSWTYSHPPGGPSSWIRLPHGTGVEFAPFALRYGVSVLPGDIFSPAGGFPDYLRLPFVLEPETISEGVSRLARAWTAYAPSAQLKNLSQSTRPVPVTRFATGT